MAAKQKKERKKAEFEKQNMEGILRIAVYSRKSKWTGKGESVENQIVMCREYIRTFIDGGENAEIIEYEEM